MNLRKRLRKQAETDLTMMTVKLSTEATKLADRIPGLQQRDLLLIAAGGRTETMKDKAITAITNNKEKELEDFFNKQQELLPEEEKPAKGKSK